MISIRRDGDHNKTNWGGINMFKDLLMKYLRLTTNQRAYVTPAILGQLQRMEDQEVEISLSIISKEIDGVLNVIEGYEG